MKDKKTKLFINIFLTAILSVLMCLTLIGCQDQQDPSSVSSTVVPSDSAYHQTEGAEAINKLIAALPDEKAFGAENVAALESIIGKYELLSDTEKTKVEYGKVEKLLSATVYLDEQTLEYIPESSNTFSLKPYLRGKNITRVTLGENRLLAGQYSVDGNNLIILDKRLKELIPSVTEIRISTDVSDDFVYTVYVGMDGDEAIFFNAENTESINKTSLKKISGGKLDFAVTKENGFAYAVCFSDNGDFVGYDFKNKRTYKLFFEFTVPSGPDAVGIPVYFEGVGGKLCTISFLDGEPIISDAAASTDKSVSISYLGSGVYGFYGSFFAEEGMKTLVIGVEGGATTVEMDNFCLYPVCGAPGFYSDDFGYDISEGGTLDIPVYLNAEKLDKVTINGKEVAYLIADGVLRITENALSGLKENEENILTIDNGYGSVSAKVTAFNGLPVMTSESVARYFTDGETPIFTFDLKGKTLKDITLNGKTVEKSS